MCSDFFLDKKTTKRLDREMQILIDRVGIDRKTLDEYNSRQEICCRKNISHLNIYF